MTAVNVVDFGARRDGRDCTSAFRHAIDFAVMRGTGKLLRLPLGFMVPAASVVLESEVA